MSASAASRLLHWTATIRLCLTRRQTRRCYGLLRSAGDVWAWLLDSNRQRHQQGEPAISNYQALCRELARSDGFGELSTVGARSVLRRYSDAWFHAANRRKAGQQDAGFPRRKRALVPVRCYHGTFTLQGQRVRLPVAEGQPELWVRLARPLPYPEADVRAVTLLADGGRLRQWRRTHLVQALLDKAELAGIVVRLVDERGTSSTCPACHRRVPKPSGREFRCPTCTFKGHRDLGRCPQHRRQGRRRTHKRRGADACRAPSRRHRAGTA
jgi:transposase